MVEPISYEEFKSTVLKHAKTMTEYAVDSYGWCMYRSESGPCLIGACIPDEDYDFKFEFQKAGSIIGYSEKRFSEIQDNLLEQVQYIHDSMASSGELISDLYPKLIDCFETFETFEKEKQNE